MIPEYQFNRMTFDLKQGSIACSLSAQAACVATTCYITYRLAKYFLLDSEPGTATCYWNFDNMMNETVQKCLLGLSTAGTLTITGCFLESINKVITK